MTRKGYSKDYAKRLMNNKLNDSDLAIEDLEMFALRFKKRFPNFVLAKLEIWTKEYIYAAKTKITKKEFMARFK